MKNKMDDVEWHSVEIKGITEGERLFIVIIVPKGEQWDLQDFRMGKQ